MRTARGQALIVAIALAIVGCESQPVVSTSTEFDNEGLQAVSSRRFSEAQVRPGVDFTRFKTVHVLEPELQFREPDRSQQEFPLTDEQQSGFRDVLYDSFRDEFTENSSIKFVDSPGEDVLGMTIRVLDIGAVVPGPAVGRVGRGGFALDATANVTFVIELSDSETGEILARGVETRSVQGAAIQSNGEMLTRWEDVEALCDRWALASRTGLEALLEFSGN